MDLIPGQRHRTDDLDFGADYHGALFLSSAADVHLGSFGGGALLVAGDKEVLLYFLKVSVIDVEQKTSLIGLFKTVEASLNFRQLCRHPLPKSVIQQSGPAYECSMFF